MAVVQAREPVSAGGQSPLAFRRSAISWRKTILLNRSALSVAWDVAFPKHDFDTGRLRRHSLDTFERACDRAEAEAAKRKSDPKTERLRRLLQVDVSLDRAWHEINDPRSRPTPAVTVEAILHCVRERGVKALKAPANIARLARCDAAAMVKINRFIARLKKAIAP
jgi:hypothetical protein